MAGVELATAYYSLVPSMDGTAAAVRAQSGGLSSVFSGIGDDAGGKIKGGILKGIGVAGAAVAALGLGNIIGDGIRTGIDFAMDGIAIAGDLGETKSAIEQVFGADSIANFEKWSGRGAAELGVTQLAALQAAQSFGVYGKAAGLAGTDLFNFSTDLAGLGTDLASFFNTSPEQAIEALGAGLRGESEPLRKYGVLLDDATLRARAFKLGIYGGTGSLTQQQRVLAAQAEIFAQTADAQGDFERTSSSLSNQQKILAANFEDAKAKLGTALLPAMTTLVTLANDKLIPILGQVVDQVGPMLADALVQSGPAFQDLLNAVVPLLPELVRAGSEILPVLIQAFVAISPALVDMAANTASAFNNMSNFFGFLAGDVTIQQLMDGIFAATGSFAEMSKGAVSLVTSVNASFQQMSAGVHGAIDAAVGFIQNLPSRARDALSGLGHLLVDSGRALIQGFIDGITSMLGPVGDAVGSVMDWAAGFFPHSPAERGPFSGAGWRDVYSGGQALMAQFAGGVADEKIAPSIGLGVQAAAVAGVSASARAGVRSAAAVPSTALGRDPIIYRLLADIRDATLAGSKVPWIPSVQAALGSDRVANTANGVM